MSTQRQTGQSQAQEQSQPNETADYLRRQPKSDEPETLLDGSEREAPVTTTDAYPSGPGTAPTNPGVTSKKKDIVRQDTDI